MLKLVVFSVFLVFTRIAKNQLVAKNVRSIRIKTKHCRVLVKIVGLDDPHPPTQVLHVKLVRPVRLGHHAQIAKKGSFDQVIWIHFLVMNALVGCIKMKLAKHHVCLVYVRFFAFCTFVICYACCLIYFSFQIL